MGVVPEGPPHVITRDIVGVNKALPPRHAPRAGVVGVAVARDVQSVRVKVGRARGIVEKRQRVLLPRHHADHRR